MRISVIALLLQLQRSCQYSRLSFSMATMSSFTESMLQRYVSLHNVQHNSNSADGQEADFQKATQHSFLVQAGKGTLEKDILTKWCRQDYLYAFVGYIKVSSPTITNLVRVGRLKGSTHPSYFLVYLSLPLLRLHPRKRHYIPP